MNGLQKYFDEDGMLFNQIEYTKGELVSYKYFNKNGEVIKEGKKQKEDFVFQGFYPHGGKKMEGLFSGKIKKGVWKYFDDYNNLEKEETYDNKGNLEGKCKIYYPGSVNLRSPV